MKIRILANTIRLRLKQQEVIDFRQYEVVTEVTEFGPSPTDQLRFILQISAEPQLTVGFEANTTTIGVPKLLAEEWTGTDKVGFDGKVDTGKGRTIEVLVEKDFICLDGPEEKNKGAYPNPKSFC